jgi:hypothetical protein
MRGWISLSWGLAAGAVAGIVAGAVEVAGELAGAVAGAVAAADAPVAGAEWPGAAKAACAARRTVNTYKAFDFIKPVRVTWIGRPGRQGVAPSPGQEFHR